MHLFKRQRTPPELVLKCCNNYEDLARSSSNQSAIDHVVKYMTEMKALLYGEGTDKPAKEVESQQLAVEAAKSKLLLHMCTLLSPLGFETRKDVAAVFSGLLRTTVDGRQPCLQYLQEHQDLLITLTKAYDKTDTALITGSMLREAIKWPAFAKYLLEHPVFYQLLASTDVETFEVASDAFLSFRELLTRHESLTRDFLAAHGDQFFKVFNASLLMSTNYVTRRQSLKLLGELLLSSGHVDAMMRYVSEASYLKLIMTLLRDPSRSIQYEAFHLFKVMVANPNKPAGVVDILKSNGDRLTRFLSSFQSDRDENDADFATEKQTLIGMLNKL